MICKRTSVTLLLLTMISMVGCTGRRSGGPASSPSPIPARTPDDPRRLIQSIAFYQQRVRDDPAAAIELAALAGLYSQRCRETGDIADAVRAENAARKSLRIRSRNNGAAYDQLALSLLTQHRFHEAEAVVRTALAARGDDPQSRDLAIEIWTESGEYDRAKAALQERGALGEDAHFKALYARMLEINGQPEPAITALKAAQAAADNDYDTPSENVAWYHMRVGDLEFSVGRVEEAERAYREALALFPRDYRVLTALTRLECGRGRWQAAVDWGRKSAAVVPTPEIVALLGDAYTALGDRKQAEEQYFLVDEIARLARAQGNVYDRQRALFCADHDRNLAEGLALARREMTIRHDIYAYDTLAWALFKAGKLQEADAAMQRALARGTVDARLTYHAGMIAYGRGDRAAGKAFLTRALATNPYFLPFAPERARRLIAQRD